MRLLFCIGSLVQDNLCIEHSCVGKNMYGIGPTSNNSLCAKLASSILNIQDYMILAYCSVPLWQFHAISVHFPSNTLEFCHHRNVSPPHIAKHMQSDREVMYFLFIFSKNCLPDCGYMNSIELVQLYTCIQYLQLIYLHVIDYVFKEQNVNSLNK